MSVFNGRIILRKGTEEDFNNSPADSYEVGELIFLEDVGKLVIKKADGQLVCVDPNGLQNYLSKKEADVLFSQVEDKLYINGYIIDSLGRLQLTSDGNAVGEPIEFSSSDSGLSFDGGYVDTDTGYLYLTKDGEPIDGFTPFYVGNASGGGGSSGSKLVFSLTTPLAFAVAETSKAANISFKFSSIDTDTQTATGDGTLQIYVNDVLKRSQTVQQGDNTINIFDFLNAGSNNVKLVLTDSYGASARRSCTISVETLGLTWSLNDTQVNSGTLTVNLVPTGTGTKTLYILVDGEVYNTSTINTSGYRVSKSIILGHGGHVIKAYCTSEVEGATITSDILIAAIAQIEEGNPSPVIACNFDESEIDAYSNIMLKYRVVDPDNNPATIEHYINDNIYSTDSIDQSEHSFSYKPTQAGDLAISMKCGSTTWTKVINVKSLEAPVEEITENLKLKMDPATMTSSSFFMFNGSRINIELSENFDTTNGGLQTDSEGNRAFVVMKGDRAVIHYNLFADDARKNGKAFKIIYKTENCSDFNATAISCADSGIGFIATANAVKMTSEQSSIEMQTCENVRTELDVIINPDSDNRLMLFLEEAIPSRGEVYSSDDNFSQNSPVGITVGSDDCNVWIYLIRCYSSELSKTEYVANYIADGKDGAEITSRYESSLIYDTAGNIDVDKVAEVNPEAHILVWHAPNISTAKTNEVTGTLTHKFVSGGAKHEWSATNVKNKVQGTSSAAYVNAGLNQDFKFNEIVFSDGSTSAGYSMTDTSIPVSYLNFKANTASQEHINNIKLADRFNTYNPYTRPNKKNGVRDTIEGHIAVLFYHNTGSVAVQVGPITVEPDQTVLYSIGCLNNSKKNTAVFGHDDIDEVACIEILNNTSDLSRFKTDDFTGENFDGKGSFDFRFISDAVSKEDIIDKWKALQSFIVSCNPDAAMGEELSSIVSYDGQSYRYDSSEYRIAKFKTEAKNYLILDSWIYHYLFTLAYCMPDNRAKNVFAGYSAVEDKWHLCFDYDNDTAMGNDNEGGLTLRYGYLDTDQIGTKNVYNAADSTIWELIRTCFADRARELYIQLENAGCWNMSDFADECDQEQKKLCTSLWIEDAYRKDINTFLILNDNTYIPMMNGKKRLQRRQFLKFQQQFISSYFKSNYCKLAQGIIRGYTPTNYAGVEPANTMTLTSYADTFIYVDVAQQPQHVRAYAGIPVTINFDSIGSMNDTEISIYNADFIQDIGDLSCLYPGVCNLSAFERLKIAKIGSSVLNYKNTNLTTVTFDNCKSIESINIGGCSNFNSALDLSRNVQLKELYTERSGTTGVSFAAGCRIRTVNLNDIASLSCKNLNFLQALSLTSYSKLTNLILENSPAVDGLDIINKAINLNRIRLTEIAWIIDNSDILVRLSRLHGSDDDGYYSDKPILTGTVIVDKISEYRENALSEIFDKLVITANNYIDAYKVDFVVDGEIVDSQMVEAGKSAEDPTTRIYNPIPVPTKEPTVDTSYYFSGWDKTFSEVTSNMTVTAKFSSETRTYTVRFFSGSSLVQTSVVDVYSNCGYTGDDLDMEGYLWTGWSKSTTNVTSDIDTYAVFEEPKLPSYKKDMTEYQYICSDDPADADVSAYSIAEFYAICEAGVASAYFNAKDKFKLLLKEGATIADEYIIMEIGDTRRHFKLADNSGDYANVSCIMYGLLNASRTMNSSNTNSGGWPATQMNKWISETMINNLLPVWRKIIQPVIILSSKGETSASIVSTTNQMFLYSHSEVFGSTDAPYCNEVDAGAESLMLACFTDTASRIKKTINGTGSTNFWWLRSPLSGNSTHFMSVSGNGISIASNAYHSDGVCLGFCLGRQAPAE